MSLNAINAALRNNRPFEITEDQKTRPMSRASSFLHRNDAPFHQERLGEIARVIADHLKNLPRQKPSEVLNHEAVKTSSKFLKTVPKTQQTDLRITRCVRELLAFKIGVESKVLDLPGNEGFEKFVSRTRLERYLAEYDHQVTVGDGGKVSLLEKNVLSPWSKLQDLVQPPETPPTDYQPCFYGQNGVQNVNMFEWSQLKPYKWEDPNQWGCQHILEVSCCTEKDPEFIGSHSWLRFKTPEGDIYSVGLYRPYKTDRSQAYKSPMRTQRGILMQPDISEFWPTPIFRIPFAITQVQFQAMKGTIERDKQGNREIFQIIGRNCTEYVKKIARIAEIELDTKKPTWELLSHRYIHRSIPTTVNQIDSHLPSPISQVFASATTLFLNSSFWFAGITCTDPQVPQNVPPYLAHLRDFFDPSKLELSHPHTLGYFTRDRILKLRTETTQQLKTQEGTKKLIDEIEFASPKRIEQITKQIT